MTLLAQLETYILQLEIKVQQLDQVNKGLQAQLELLKSNKEDKEA